MQTLQQRRERENRQINERLRTLMAAYKTLEAQTALVEQLAARDVHRQYLAFVMGALVAGGTADAPIDRHPRDRLNIYQATLQGMRDVVAAVAHVAGFARIDGNVVPKGLV
ncbi:hypothetical protein ABGA94_09400, partial [Stenotrophomonas sp. 3diitr2024]